jgi:hypothetical protein
MRNAKNYESVYVCTTRRKPVKSSLLLPYFVLVSQGFVISPHLTKFNLLLLLLHDLDLFIEHLFLSLLVLFL